MPEGDDTTQQPREERGPAHLPMGRSPDGQRQPAQTLARWHVREKLELVRSQVWTVGTVEETPLGYRLVFHFEDVPDADDETEVIDQRRGTITNLISLDVTLSDQGLLLILGENHQDGGMLDLPASGLDDQQIETWIDEALALACQETQEEGRLPLAQASAAESRVQALLRGKRGCLLALCLPAELLLPLIGAHHQLVVEDDDQIGGVPLFWLGRLIIRGDRARREEHVRDHQVACDVELGDDFNVVE